MSPSPHTRVRDKQQYGSINVTVRGSGCVRWVRTASGALSLRASASTHGSKRASMAFRSDAAQRSRTSHACCVLHCMLHAVCCTLHDREVRSQPGALHAAATACPWRTHRAQAGGIPNQSDLVRVLTSTRPRQCRSGTDTVLSEHRWLHQTRPLQCSTRAPRRGIHRAWGPLAGTHEYSYGVPATHGGKLSSVKAADAAAALIRRAHRRLSTQHQIGTVLLKLRSPGAEAHGWSQFAHARPHRTASRPPSHSRAGRVGRAEPVGKALSFARRIDDDEPIVLQSGLRNVDVQPEA